MPERVLPMFFSRNCMVSGLKFRSLIHLSSLGHMLWVNGQCSNLIPLHVAVRFPTTIYWRDCLFPIVCSCLLCHRLTINVWVYLWALHPAPLIFCVFFCLFVCLFCLLGMHLERMEFPRLGVKPELPPLPPPPSYTRVVHLFCARWCAYVGPNPPSAFGNHTFGFQIFESVSYIFLCVISGWISHISDLIWYLSYFTWYGRLYVHSCCCKRQYFILYGWTACP